MQPKTAPLFRGRAPKLPDQHETPDDLIAQANWVTAEIDAAASS